MVDIARISLEELRADLVQTEKDILVCTLAISQGITTYSGGSVADRLEKNKQIAEVILAEMRRRGALSGAAGDA